MTQLQITHPIGKSLHEVRLKKSRFARVAEHEELWKENEELKRKLKEADKQ